MDDSRFFSMNQLWQSLGITLLIGGMLAGGIAYGVMSFGKTPQQQAIMATTTAATSPLPAAAGSALGTATTTKTTTTPVYSFDTLKLSGQAAIVVDLSNGQTLYSQNADTALPLASLTKLLTIYGAQNALSADSIVTISSSSLAQDGSYGLVEGETFAYKDIARFALVGSSNDAAEAIAEAAETARGLDASQFMGRAIASAGLEHTRASNGTGLDIDTTEASAYGTARDMAKLAAKFIERAPDLSKTTTRPSVTVTSTAGTSHSISNTNPYAAGIAGIQLSKTGYTDIAGGNLVVVFDAAIGHPVAVVVLGSTRDARFTDVGQLVRAARASLNTEPAS